MGSKYQFKPDNNPPPGLYNVESGDGLTKSKSRSAHIREPVFPHRRPQEGSPDPGSYDKHLRGFGEDVTHRMHIGGPYQFKADGNPPPGYYNIYPADKHIYARADRSSVIREESTAEMLSSPAGAHGSLAVLYPTDRWLDANPWVPIGDPLRNTVLSGSKRGTPSPKNL